MGATLDQANLGENGSDVSSDNITLTLPNAAAAGSVIVVGFMWASSSFFSATVSGGGLTWSSMLAYDIGPGNHQRAICIAYAPSGLAASTVLTVTFTGAVTQKQVCASSWLGVHSSLTVEDTDVFNEDPPADNPTWSLSLTTLTPGALLVAVSEAAALGNNTPAGSAVETHQFDLVVATNTFVMEYIVAGAAGVHTIGGQWDTPAFNGVGHNAIALKAVPSAGRRIYKRLYGPALLGTAAADLYTTPSDVRTTIRHVHASNSSGSPAGFTFSVGNDAASTRIWDDDTIASKDFIDEHQDIPLDPGEKIQAYSDTSSAIVLVVDGIEESI